MFFNKTLETISADDLEQLQIEKLQSTLNRVCRNVSFYKNSFDGCGVNIEKIRSINDLRRLPFTAKADLRKSYPYDMFAVPLKDIVRIHATSGTTGKPVVVGYTRNDIAHWTECSARLLTAAGIDDKDVVQIAFQYSLFTGGFGFHMGASRIGASVIPSSSTTSAEKQISIMKDYKTTAIICSPSYAAHMSAALKESGLHPEELFLRVGIFGSEPWTEKLRDKLDMDFHIRSMDSYGLTEVMGPGIAGECEERNGLHVNEDHFIVEIIDPKTLDPVRPGEKGELVFTTIAKEGFPLVRYRTGDISRIIEGECPCGRTLKRIEKITGRTDDMIFIEEQKIFPSQLEEVLLESEWLQPRYQICLEREAGRDTMEIKIEISENIPFLDELKTLEKLKLSLEQKIQSMFGIAARITPVEPKSLGEAPEGKVKRVLDRRDM